MTIEVLFRQNGQNRAFLLMLLMGAALTVLISAGGQIHKKSRVAGLCADGLCGAMAALGLGQCVLWTGAIRAYALLGSAIGCLLMLGAFGPIVSRWERRKKS